MAIRAYTLPPDQVHRAFEAGGPLVDLQIDPAKLATMRVAVVEVDGQIVAYWVSWYALHIEPLWIQEAWRAHPGVGRGILDAMRQGVCASGEGVAFCEIADENLSVMAPLAERVGFQQAPGALYYLVVDPAWTAAQTAAPPLQVQE